MNTKKRKHPSSSNSCLISIYSTPPKIQNFSIPRNIIFYISKNISTVKVYEKLINICKYFYFQKPIIILSNLAFKTGFKFWYIEKVNGCNYFGIMPMTTKMITTQQKIWLNGSLKICDSHQHEIASTLIPQISQFFGKVLVLTGQRLTLNEFNFLALNGGIIELDFKGTFIINENGSSMQMEKIIENLPNLRKFYYSNGDGNFAERDSINSETAEKFVKISHFNKLKVFWVRRIPEVFNFKHFFENLREPITMDIDLFFDRHLSETYKNELIGFINCLISAGINQRNRPPLIYFPEMTDGKFKALKNFRKKYQKKHKIV